MARPMNNLTRLERQLWLDEGYRQYPYKCSSNKLTIGIGRNIEDNGISKDEALHLLRNDIMEVRVSLMRFSWFNRLNDERQDAVLNMAFNLGIPRFMSFKKMIEALSEMDYELAADEALDSKWATQVGERADRIARIIKDGK
jgi:lysozyme